MPTSSARVNPFDFRRPVFKPGMYAGRGWLRRLVRDTLASLETGVPSHLLVSGDRGSGKSSVLTLLEAEATRDGFLSIPTPLSEGMLETGSTFFESLLAHVVDALVATGAKALADAPTDYRAVTISPGRLVFVMEALAESAVAAGFKGIVVTIDRAELLNDDDELLQTLDSLSERLSRWLFVIAGQDQFLDEIKDVYPPLLQHTRSVRLLPFRSRFTVLQFLANRLDTQDDTPLITGWACDELLRASRGNPRLLTILSYYAWEAEYGVEDSLGKSPHHRADSAISDQIGEALPPERKAFQLKPNAIIAAVREVKRTDDQVAGVDPDTLLERLDLLKDLGDNDLATVALLAQFEQLSLAEFASAMSLRNGCLLADLTSESANRREELQEHINALEQIGVLDQNEGRFHLCGGAISRVYIAALARARDLYPRLDTGPEPTYATYVGYELMQRAQRHLERPLGDLPEVAGSIEVRNAAIAPAAPAWLRKFTAAVAQGDARRMTEVGRFYAGTTAEDDDDGTSLLFLYLTLRVAFGDAGAFATEEAAVAAVCRTSKAMSSGDISASLNEWRDEAETPLADVHVQITEVAGATAPPSCAAQYLGVLIPGRVARQVTKKFNAGELEDAISELELVIPTVQHAADLTVSPVADHDATGDLLLRLGFLHMFQNNEIEARTAFERAAVELEKEGNIDGPNGLLLRYNESYLRALRGEYAAAAQTVREIEPEPQSTVRSYFMVFFAPRVPHWSPSDTTWNTTVVRHGELANLIAAQALAYEAMAGSYTSSEFAERASALYDRAPECGGVYRTLGWIFLDRYRDSTAASFCFGRALKLPEQPPIVADELKFATQQLVEPQN